MTGRATLEREAAAWWGDTRAWLGESWRPLTAIAIGLVTVGWSASARSRLWVVPALLALAVACTWYANVSRAAHLEARYHHRRGRIAVSLGLAAVTFALPFALAPVRRHWGPQVQSSADFVGVGLLLLGLGGLVAELRLLPYWQRRRGPVAIAIALLALVGCLVVDPSSAWMLVLILAAAVGGEMMSEDWLPPAEWPEATARWLVLGGLAIVALALGQMVAIGVAPVTAVVIVIVLSAVVWLTAARSDNLLLTLVVAGALLWAGAPRTIGPAAVARPNPDPYFAVFGDSYISGEGASIFQTGTNTKVADHTHTNQCRRANTAWPVLLADARVEGLPHHTLFLPCSGAVASQLWESPHLEDSAAPWPSAQELALYRLAQPGFAQGKKPAFAFVSIGGNDALFSVIGETCVAPGSCAEFEKPFLDSLDALGPRLDRAYHDLSRQLGPDVPVIAVPYPDPIAAGTVACPGVFLDSAERQLIHDYLAKLDGAVEAAAGRAGFYYLDTMVGALADGGSRLCEGTGAVGLNFIAVHPQGGSVADLLTPTNWTHNSLHPNEEGHRLMRAAAERWFDTNPAATLRPPHVKELDAATIAASEAPKPQIVPSGWLPDRAQDLARRVAFPIALALAGAWMLLIVLLREVAESGWTVAGKLRQAFEWTRTPPPDDPGS
jgi:hypothetical protein